MRLGGAREEPLGHHHRRHRQLDARSPPSPARLSGALPAVATGDFESPPGIGGVLKDARDRGKRDTGLRKSA